MGESSHSVEKELSSRLLSATLVFTASLSSSLLCLFAGGIMTG